MQKMASSKIKIKNVKKKIIKKLKKKKTTKGFRGKLGRKKKDHKALRTKLQGSRRIKV